MPGLKLSQLAEMPLAALTGSRSRTGVAQPLTGVRPTQFNTGGVSSAASISRRRF
jgi:hypothetical protein